MRLLFVMDRVETVQETADTSFALMLAAQERGHEVFHCLPQDLSLRGNKASALVARATMQRGAGSPIMLGAAECRPLSDFSSVWVRKDPPFDSMYLWATQVLECARADTFVVNDPRGLRDANEKLYACHFPELMPKTFVGCKKSEIRAFVDDIGGRAVIKPLDGAGGEGVMALLKGDSNFNAIIEATTRNESRFAMVQEFLPAVRQGDKRVLLLEGEPLGAIMRVPRSDDLRSNIHVGGSVESAVIDDHDRRIIAAVAPRLLRDGLFFVGLDVIGGKLTEVNVTSPTGIQQMSRLSGQDLSGRVVAWLESRLA